MSDAWREMTILIVDDSARVQDALSTLYSDVGLKVVGRASNGIGALLQIKALKPDLVSMDIIMPEMDGIECFRKIRDGEDFANCRPLVFFMSYLATEPKILDSYKEEIPDYYFVPKNYSSETVRQALAKLIAMHKEKSSPGPQASKGNDPSEVTNGA